MTHDPKCYELAEHFLRDEAAKIGPDRFKAECGKLAEHIQEAIEDFLMVAGS
jgi:hypothetical protein